MSAIVAVIQARMGSSRLPGKVLADLEGLPMLARVIRRTSQAELLDRVIAATTSRSEDNLVEEACGALRVPCFRGSEEDVLDRYYEAARAYDADVVVRITGDCPFIDPEIVNKVVGAFLDLCPDYASNVEQRTFPRGLDTEVMSIGVLERAWQEASKPFERTHVTPYIRLNPNRFRVLSVTNDTDFSQYRWTVDTSKDMDFARAIYAHFQGDDSFSWRDVISLLERCPELSTINADVEQKPLEQG